MARARRSDHGNRYPVLGYGEAPASRHLIQEVREVSPGLVRSYVHYD